MGRGCRRAQRSESQAKNSTPKRSGEAAPFYSHACLKALATQRPPEWLIVASVEFRFFHPNPQTQRLTYSCVASARTTHPSSREERQDGAEMRRQNKTEHSLCPLCSLCSLRPIVPWCLSDPPSRLWDRPTKRPTVHTVQYGVGQRRQRSWDLDILRTHSHPTYIPLAPCRR